MSWPVDIMEHDLRITRSLDSITEGPDDTFDVEYIELDRYWWEVWDGHVLPIDTFKESWDDRNILEELTQMADLGIRGYIVVADQFHEFRRHNIVESGSAWVITIQSPRALEWEEPFETHHPEDGQ